MDPTTAPGSATATSLLEMRGITKRFPGVVANDGVDLVVRAGEVLALLGENGAGKSTLMKVLFGLQRPDAGEILLDGTPVTFRSPTEAIAAGIGMVHQHFMLVPTMTVAENVALGAGGFALGPAPLAWARRRIRELSAAYHLDVDPDARVWQLAVGERQRVEILKVLVRDARVLVLDEPTAVLTPGEVDQLLRTLRAVADDGCGIVFISHKLHEVLAFADRITVLRDGAVTGHADPATATRAELAQMMVGRPVLLVPERVEVTRTAPVLEVEHLCVVGRRRARAVDDVSFTVCGGEVFGLAGVSGNGQRELADAIAGLAPVAAGTVAINGVPVTGAPPGVVRDAGIAYVPEERMRDGAIADFTVWENALLHDHRRGEFHRHGLLRMGAIRPWARQLVADFAVKTPGIDAPVRTLSGGNIQKLVMARELSAHGNLLLACQPTRGVDIGAAEYIHARLMAARADGMAVVVVSEDLDELLALSDRIGVMFEGRLVDVVERADCTPERLGLLMTGS